MKTRAWILALILLATTAIAIAEFKVGPGGLYIEVGTPLDQVNKLYNVAGTLYWDGAPIGGPASLCGITYSATPKYAHIADYSNSIQTAINTGRPVYIPEGAFTLSAPLTMSTPGQILTGAGVGRTILYVPDEPWAKTKSGNYGILYLISGEPGPVIRDLSIRFTQPAEQSDRDNLYQFLPAIRVGSGSANGCARTKIQNVEILGALTGIELGGVIDGSNSGGTFIDNVRICAFKYGIHADYLYDNTHFTNIDIGPYGTYETPTGLSEHQTTIFRLSDTYGIFVNRQDGLFISNSSFEDVGVGIYAGKNDAAVSAFLNNCSFTNVNHQALYAIFAQTVTHASNCSFSFDNTTSTAVAIYLGSLANTMFSSCEFRLVGKQGRLIDASGGPLALTNCKFYIDSSVTTTGFIQVASTSATVVSNNVIEFSSSTTNTPFIYGGSGSGFTLMNNRFIPAAGGRDAYGTVAADYHIIIGNYFNGWTSSGAANQKADNIS